MVHTAEAHTELNSKDIAYLERIYGPVNRKNPGSDMKIPYVEGISVTIKCYEFGEDLFRWYAYIHINFIDLLGTSTILPAHLSEVKRKLNDCMSSFCLKDSDDLVLRRIDYRFDSTIEQNKRQILLKILQKSVNKSGFLKKRIIGLSIYHSSKSKHTLVYGKEEERRAKKIPCKPYEEDVLRFEVALDRKHLQYRKRKNGIDCSLDNYFIIESYHMYINLLAKLYLTGDFYQQYHASKRIDESSIIKDKYKPKIIEFMIRASKARSLSDAQSSVGYYTAKRYMNLLAREGINPILIPKHYGVTYIPNPLKELNT